MSAKADAVAAALYTAFVVGDRVTWNGFTRGPRSGVIVTRGDGHPYNDDPRHWCGTVAAVSGRLVTILWDDSLETTHDDYDRSVNLRHLADDADAMARGWK